MKVHLFYPLVLRITFVLFSNIDQSIIQKKIQNILLGYQNKAVERIVYLILQYYC